MRKFIFTLIIICFCLFLYAEYVGNTGVVSKEYSIYSETIPNKMSGIKIVHFSDLLFKSSIDEKNLKESITIINNQNPDIIVFTGDLINKDVTEEEITLLTDYLKSLNSNLKKYAILGDNDNKTSKGILENAKFTILDDENDLIYLNDKTPILISNYSDLDNYSNDNNYYSIFLTHKPDDFDDLKSLDINLVLAGHSLGGQVRLPFYGAVIKKEGANSYLDNYYVKNDTIMYVNFGLGCEKTNLRFLNKPSVNIYRLYSK